MGLEAAVRRAKAAVGDQDVLVMGADVAGQALAAGLLDEVHLHLAPVVLGQGTGLLGGCLGELIPQGEPVAGAATHLRFRVRRAAGHGE